MNNTFDKVEEIKKKENKSWRTSSYILSLNNLYYLSNEKLNKLLFSTIIKFCITILNH